MSILTRIRLCFPDHDSDLSVNSLYGTIPASLFSLPNITAMYGPQFAHLMPEMRERRSFAHLLLLSVFFPLLRSLLTR